MSAMSISQILASHCVKNNALPHTPHYQNNASTHQPHNQNNHYMQAWWRVLRSTWIQKFARPSALGVSDPGHHLFFHWISFFVVLVLGFRFLLFFSTDQARHTRPPRDRSRPKLLPSLMGVRPGTFFQKSFCF